MTYSRASSALCGAAEVSVVTYTSTRLSPVSTAAFTTVASSPGVCMRSGYYRCPQHACRCPYRVMSVPDGPVPDQSAPARIRFSAEAQAAWFASLPTMFAAAAALFTDPSGRVLLVKPNYRDHWSLPGGMLEHGEPPHVGCRREVAEELGIDIVPGPLLVLGWAGPDRS